MQHKVEAQDRVHGCSQIHWSTYMIVHAVHLNDSTQLLASNLVTHPTPAAVGVQKSAAHVNSHA